MNGESSNSDQEEKNNISPALECAASTCTTHTSTTLPSKSREKYEIAYKKFQDWCSSNKIKLDEITENVTIAFMTNISKTLKPSSLWSTYSMLRSTLLIKQNIDISKFNRLRYFLQLQSTGYKSKKSNVLSADHIKKFIEKAPDDKFLFTKVVLIFGISGGCRRQELKNLLAENIQDLGNELLVKLMDTNNKTDRSFIIPGRFYMICRKYMSLLHPQLKHFFQNYKNGKCVKQVAGINKIGEQPKIIARYLRLPEPNSYTGHSFRRSRAILLTDSKEDTPTLKNNCKGWKSTAVMESLEQSLCKKESVGIALLPISAAQDLFRKPENRQSFRESNKTVGAAVPNSSNNNGQFELILIKKEDASSVVRTVPSTSHSEVNSTELCHTIKSEPPSVDHDVVPDIGQEMFISGPSTGFPMKISSVFSLCESSGGELMNNHSNKLLRETSKRPVTVNLVGMHHDHTYSQKSRRQDAEIFALRNRNSSLAKQLKTAKQKIRRLTRRLTIAKDLNWQLKKKLPASDKA